MWESLGAGHEFCHGTPGKSFKFQKPWVPLEYKLHEVQVSVLLIANILCADNSARYVAEAQQMKHQLHEKMSRGGKCYLHCRVVERIRGSETTWNSGQHLTRTQKWQLMNNSLFYFQNRNESANDFTFMLWKMIFIMSFGL